MSTSAVSTRRVLADALKPAGLTRGASLATDAGLVVAGAIVTALLAQVSVPLWPVPITGQTLAVLLVGGSLGAVRGASSMLLYALAGLAGAPVFAGWSGGPHTVLAPSFGFIIGFIPAALVIGWLAQRAWDRKPLLAFAGMLVATVIPFLVGVPYMGVVLGKLGDAAFLWNAGVAPFVVGGIVKALIAALVLPGAWAGVRALDRATKR